MATPPLQQKSFHFYQKQIQQRFWKLESPDAGSLRLGQLTELADRVEACTL
jgi:hypothetical protein